MTPPSALALSALRHAAAATAWTAIPAAWPRAGVAGRVALVASSILLWLACAGAVPIDWRFGVAAWLTANAALAAFFTLRERRIGPALESGAPLPAEGVDPAEWNEPPVPASDPSPALLAAAVSAAVAPAATAASGALFQSLLSSLAAVEFAPDAFASRLFLASGLALPAGFAGGWLLARDGAVSSVRAASAGAAAALALAAFEFVRLLLLEAPLASLPLVSSPVTGFEALAFAALSVAGSGQAAAAVGSWRNRADVPRSVLRGAARLACFAAGAAIWTASSGPVSLGLARVAEKNARPEAALALYERALRLRGSREMRSYVQFRAALLYHRRGDEAAALSAFESASAVHNAIEPLADQARAFAARLRGANRSGRRVVIPGIEHRTELRHSWCLPNSLALVLRHWGVSRAAAEIGRDLTRPYVGTKGADLFRYIEELGLDAHARAGGDEELLRRCVDAGLPVLAFLPGHVVAVFGYDERLGTLVTYDTARWDNWVDVPFDEFDEEWRRAFRAWCVVAPADRRALLPGRVRAEADAAYPRVVLAASLPEGVAASWRRGRLLAAALARDPGLLPALLERDERAPLASRLRPGTEAPAARALVRWALQPSPDPEAAVDVVAWLSRRGRPIEALAVARAVRDAVAADDLPAELTRAVGRLFVERKDWRRAAAAFHEAARREPLPPSDRLLLARALEARGERSAAFDQLAGLVEETRDLRAAREAMSRLRTLASRGSRAERLASLEKRYRRLDPFASAPRRAR